MSLKKIALTLVFCLIFQDFSYAYSSAAKISFEPHLAQQAEKQKNLSWAKNFLPNIPGSVATVEDAWQAPASNTTVILVQDAHTNTSSQLNQAKLFDILFEYGVTDTVFTEAAKGNVNLTELRSSTSLVERERVAKEYLHKGLLHGIEYLDLTSEHEFRVEGVEEPGLYFESIDVYRQIVDKREKFVRYLGQIESTIEVLKSKLLNRTLLEFLEKHSRAQREEANFSDHVDQLFAQASQISLELKDYPHFQKLLELKGLELQIDFKTTAQESHPVIAVDLAGYVKHLDLLSAIDMQELLEEKQRLEGVIFERLAVNEDETKLLRSIKAVHFFKKLFHLSLTPQEYRESKTESFTDLRVLSGFLNEKLMMLEDHYDKAIFLKEDFDTTAALCKRFYELTYRRDEMFLKNMPASGTSVLITGGYHAVNLKHLLQERNISYISIIPQVTHETDIPKYEQILLSQPIPASPSTEETSAATLAMTSFAAGKEIPGPVMAQSIMVEIGGARLAKIPYEKLTLESVKRIFGDLKVNPLLVNWFNSLGEFPSGVQVEDDKSSEGKRGFVPFRLDDGGVEFFYDYLKLEIVKSMEAQGIKTKLLPDKKLRTDAISLPSYVLTIKQPERNVPYALLIYTMFGPIYVDLIEMYNTPSSDPNQIKSDHFWMKKWVNDFQASGHPEGDLGMLEESHSRFVLTQFTRVNEMARKNFHFNLLENVGFLDPWYRVSEGMDVFPREYRNPREYLTLFVLERYNEENQLTDFNFTPAYPTGVSWQDFLENMMWLDKQSVYPGTLYANSSVGIVGLGTGIDALLLASYGVKKIHGTDPHRAPVVLSNLNAEFAKLSGQVDPHTEFVFEQKRRLPSKSSKLNHIFMNTPSLVKDDPALSSILDRKTMPIGRLMIPFSEFAALLEETAGFVRAATPEDIKTVALRISFISSSAQEALEALLEGYTDLIFHPNKNTEHVYLMMKRDDGSGQSGARLANLEHFDEDLMRAVLDEFGTYSHENTESWVQEFMLSDRGRKILAEFLNNDIGMSRKIEEPVYSDQIDVKAEVLTFEQKGIRRPLGILFFHEDKMSYFDFTEIYEKPTRLINGLEWRLWRNAKHPGVSNQVLDYLKSKKKEMHSAFMLILTRNKRGLKEMKAEDYRFFNVYEIRGGKPQFDINKLRAPSVSHVYFNPADYHSRDWQDALLTLKGKYPQLFRNKRILVMGTGTGIEAFYLGNSDPQNSLVAVDKFEGALFLTRLNVLFGKKTGQIPWEFKVDALNADNLPKDETFDWGMMNTPEVDMGHRHYFGEGVVRGAHGIPSGEFEQLFGEIKRTLLGNPEAFFLMRIAFIKADGSSNQQAFRDFFENQNENGLKFESMPEPSQHLFLKEEFFLISAETSTHAPGARLTEPTSRQAAFLKAVYAAKRQEGEIVLGDKLFEAGALQSMQVPVAPVSPKPFRLRPSLSAKTLQYV